MPQNPEIDALIRRKQEIVKDMEGGGDQETKIGVVQPKPRARGGTDQNLLKSIGGNTAQPLISESRK